MNNSEHNSSIPTSNAASCRLDRRLFLQALAGAAGVAFIGGCSGDENGAKAVDNSIQVEVVGAEFKIAGAGNLKPGEALAFTLPDQTPGLVFATKDGVFHALSAKCTHAGCIVTWQNSDELHCPCHGSRFDLNGGVLKGPATAPLPIYTARQQGDAVLIRIAK